MDFLRLLAADLHALRAEAKRKYPVVKEAVDRALEALPALQQQYAALLRVEGRAPGPGHPLFQSESVLRPFLLACNHTNASHKILVLALASIQRLVSWDAIEPASVGSILRVLQIQAEKNAHADVQVKLLQTLLQLMTLAYEEKKDAGPQDKTKQQTAVQDTGQQQDSELVGNEDMVMQAVWICMHLHATSSSASSVVGNTAAMTIRQLVSLAFGKVHASPEAKHVGVLLFQELCFMSREENGVWLKRTAVSPMSAALGVELLETVLAAHYALFRDDVEFKAVLKQQMTPLVQSVLEMGCNDKSGGSANSGITGPTNTSITSSNTTGAGGPFFPLLVRGMRLASTMLCHFAICLPGECALILHALLEIIATGTYTSPDSTKSPPTPSKSDKFSPANAIANLNIAKEAKNFLAHSGSSGGSSTSSATGGSGGGVNFVTWPVLLSLEVLNRVCLEPDMVAAMVNYPDGVLVAITRTTSSVIMTSPPSDFKLQGLDAAAALRSGLELLNEQDTPVLQQFFMAVRVAASCQCNMAASIFELSRAADEEEVSERLAKACVAVVAPAVVQSMNCVMRHCREVDLVTMSLKSYHVLATIASRLRANMKSQSARDTWCKQMDEVVLTCLRALCGYSFPLPEGIRGNSKGSVSTSSNGAGDHSDESVVDDGESCLVVISWREVHAMKALFGAAHVMEEELSQIEWCILLEGFEIVVGLTDPKLKNGQQKLPTKNYRISAFRIEDEDVEQQLVMLSSSVVDFFHDALKLSSAALRKLLGAVRRVSWDQVGLPFPTRDTETIADSTNSASSIDEWTIVDSSDVLNSGSNHHMRIYQNYLGVGLTGSGSFIPCFALRMLTQLAPSSKRCFEEVMRELVLMSTFVPQAPLTAAQFPQLGQFQLFATENILQLMQNALQNIVNSLSPTANVKPLGVEDIDAAKEDSVASPHVFNQQELFVPLLKLVRSDMKDRTLSGILELLNACGHLINSGWPLILAAVQEACEVGDGKTQVLAFKCLRLIVDDLIVSIPSSYLPDCIKCIGRFGCCAKDVNISLTAVNELWSVADVVGKQRSRQESDPSKRKGGQWGFLFSEFSTVALNDRAEVRNCAINTLFGTAVTYGAQFDLTEWQLFMNSTVLPLAAKLGESQKKVARTQGKKDDSKAAGYMVHHSRDNAEKQWNESRVLVLTGISRVLEINWHHLLQHTSWFSSIWRELLNHVAVNAAFGMPKEVVLAAVKTLQTLLQVSSAGDFDHIAQSQPVRAGVGMRVVGGALVSSAIPTSAATPSILKRASSAPLYRDPVLWEEAFSQLLGLCDGRQLAAQKDKNPVLPWKEDEEQEIASAVVSVLVALYMQANEYEFKDVRNVEKMLDLFQALVSRHVLGTPAIASGAVTKAITNITTNSLQSRVLNAFEECSSFASHPEVHTKILDQLVGYVTQSLTKDLVFFTRHALTSLAKLYASVSPEAREKRFLSVLFSIQPFLKFEGGDSTGPGSSSNMPLTAAQKAATQLWKHALRVLLVVISGGLAAVRLAEACWRPLLETIAGFVQPNGGRFPSCVQSEEDEVLVLSVLECVVDSTIALLGDGSEIKYHVGQQYNAFIGDLVALLCSGVDAVEHNKHIIRCCVRQLTTMCVQEADSELSAFARARLVACCNTALVRFADLDSATQSKPLSPKPATEELESSSQLSSPSKMERRSDPQLLASHERLVILLSSALEVDMQPRSLMTMFPALCGCISSSDLEVRQLVQRLLLSGRLSEYCLELMDAQERYSR